MLKNLPTKLAVTAAVVILFLSAIAVPQAKAISFFYRFNLYLGKLYSFGLAALTNKVFLHDSYDNIWNDTLANNISFLAISNNNSALDLVTQKIHKSQTFISSDISFDDRGSNLLEVFTSVRKNDGKILTESDLSIIYTKERDTSTIRNNFSSKKKTVDLWRLLWLMVRN